MQVNRELVFVCTGSDCKKSGAKSLGKEIKSAISQAPLKGKCKLIKTKCMDLCKSAPVVIVRDQFCKKATSAKIIAMLNRP